MGGMPRVGGKGRLGCTTVHGLAAARASASRRRSCSGWGASAADRWALPLGPGAHSRALIELLASCPGPAGAVKKKESKLYGAHFKDVDHTQKATKVTFDSDDE